MDACIQSISGEVFRLIQGLSDRQGREDEAVGFSEGFQAFQVLAE